MLSRYVLAAREHDADVIVRITADCPLTDPAIVDAVHPCTRGHTTPTTQATMSPPTFPEGYDCEVFTCRLPARVDGEATLAV